MVVAVVLGGAGLAADIYAGDVGFVGGASGTVHHIVHAACGNVEILTADACFVLGVKLLVAGGVGAIVAHQMGCVVIAAVGNDACQVGHLQGYNLHLALSDAVGVDGGECPALLAVPLVVECGVGDVARLDVGQVCGQLDTKTEAVHVVVPDGEAILAVFVYVFVFALLDDTAVGVVEVRVAGHFDGLLHTPCRGVVVAADDFVAHKARGRGDDAQMQGNHSLCHLEDGAGRILGLQGSVEKGFGYVLVQLFEIGSADTPYEQVGVVAGCGEKGEHFACGRLDGHDAATLVGHHFLGILLQVGIDGGVEVLSLDGHGVLLPVHVGADFAVVHIHLHYFFALHTAQHFLVGCFETALAYVVSPFVVGLFFKVLFVHLAHIAQHVGGDGLVIYAQGALGDVEALELV